MLASVIFTAPWALAGLAVLPLLWWLLRVTPPAPRSQSFPAIRLLAGLVAPLETPARTPPWLLALRILAAGLVIVALSGPVLDAGGSLPGQGPVLLVIDDGWAAAPDWPRRLHAAGSVLDRAQRAGRATALLATAPDPNGAPPAATPPMPAQELRARVAALAPRAWPPDRQAAAVALAGWRHPGAAIVYIADGLTDGPDFSGFAAALGHAGTVTELCCDRPPARLLLPPRAEADRLVARLVQAPQPVAGDAAVLAQSGDGRTLARAVIALPAGATSGEAAIALPPELRNRLTRMVLEGAPSAGAVVLLDERWRRRPVGLLAGDQVALRQGGGETPLTGSLFFVRRALSPFTELREGSLEPLLARNLSVLILADRNPTDGPERTALIRWVEQGGLLIRFAGPRSSGVGTADTNSADPLLPEKLLDGERRLGGALSWSQPAGLAPFPPTSPFAGLAVPEEVKINRQVLAEPSPGLAAHSWASLADGTPLVTEAARGAGRVVLFHVTANADWSNLPLSGLFVDMLRRLVQLSAGVADTADDATLSPVETLDGYGQLSPPPPAATGVTGRELATAIASPRHPPGLYGPENGRRALNLGAMLAPPEAAPAIAGARVEPIGAMVPERPIGPWLLSAALVLLIADLLIGLKLRGLLPSPGRGKIAARLLILGLAFGLAAQTHTQAQAPAQDPAQDPASAHPALATRLAAIVTGDDAADRLAQAGLIGLTGYVNRRTAASLAPPDAVTPGQDDLSFYPLLYWPITADTQALNQAAIAALNDYMARGGIVLIDTSGGSADSTGSGAGFAPGVEAALLRAGTGLSIPPLAPLTADHVLARAFYLLAEFPGRYAGETVWVQRDEDRANDSVSPVIIGANGWAAAWAVDGAGRNPYATVPNNAGTGGGRQRLLAYRFGVNLVMYALTGNYKGDQVHVPQILQRLGQ